MAAIHAEPYALPLRTPYRWSKGEHRERAGLIIRVDLDGGTGWGEAALPPHVIYPGAAFAEQCRALLEGLDAADDEFLAELDLREVPARIRCGIASAWHSARAAQQGKPLAAYLGGPDRPPAPRVPVNDLIGDATPELCVKRARDAVARGQDTVKVKCGIERALDLARIGALREEFPALRIRVDPNESWLPGWALEQLRAMAQFRIDYVEEPLPRGTAIATYGKLRQECPIPIALDDSVRSLIDVQLIIAEHAADVLILKPPRLGGPERTLEIIDAVAPVGIKPVVTASLETTIGLTVALHCCALLPAPIPPCGIGTARFFARDIASPLPIEDGFMAVPTAPGLGLAPAAA